MLKDSIEKNNSTNVNSREVEKLQKVLPQYFDKDGNFKLEEFKNMLSTEEVDLNKEGYGLNFLGKSYAKYESALETETVLTPDIEHNKKEVNKDSENLYIVGDNLDGLKHLLKSYSNKIKSIYIDPPYNTGSDDFVYPDNFSFDAKEMSEKIGIEEDEAKRILNLVGQSTHSAWLTFMYPRLLLARDLLADNGVILISIDNNEQDNLKLLCDEIFGEENFVETIIWEKKAGAKGVPPKNMLVNVHEYIVAYQKSDSFRFSGELRTEEDGFKNPDNDPRGPWRESNIKSTIKPADQAFTIKNPKTGKEYTNTWAFSKESLDKMILDNRILWKENLPKQKEFLNEMTHDSKAIKSSWGVFDAQSTTVHLKKLVPEVQFNNPKPLGLMKYLVNVVMEKNDIILDFFAGSSTTAEAVLQTNAEDKGNRKYIMIQIPEEISENRKTGDKSINTISEYGITRIKRAATKIKEDTSADIDYGFKTYYVNEIPENTLNKLEDFSPKDNTSLLSVDFSTDVYSFNGVRGSETILTTLLNKDGYGLGVIVEPYRLDSYEAIKKDNSLYIIDEGLTSDDVMVLVRNLENSELNINRVVVYAHSISFSVLHELRNNLKNLKNSKTVHLIEEY